MTSGNLKFMRLCLIFMALVFISIPLLYFANTRSNEQMSSRTMRKELDNSVTKSRMRQHQNITSLQKQLKIAEQHLEIAEQHLEPENNALEKLPIPVLNISSPDYNNGQPVVLKHWHYEFPPFFMEWPNFLSDDDESDFYVKNGYIEHFFVESKEFNITRFFFNDTRHTKADVYLIRNGTWTGEDCGWPNKLEKFLRVHTTGQVEHFQKLAIAMAPQSVSFQHFMDGALPKLALIEKMLKDDPEMKILATLSDRYKTTEMLFERIFGRDKIVLQQSKGTVYQADELLVACIVPPLHPTLWHAGREMLGIPFVSPEKRTIVYYLSRNDDNMHLNPGRTILNEEKFVSAMHTVIAKYNIEFRKPKKLDDIVFKKFFFSEYENLDEIFDAMSQAVVLIGPHGGGMMSLNFAPDDGVASVIEFHPKGWDNHIYWIQSQLKEFGFWHLKSEWTTGQQLIVDISSAKTAVEGALLRLDRKLN